MFITAENYLHSVKSLLEESNSVDIAVAFWGQGAELLVPSEGKKMRILCNLEMGGTNPAVIKNLQSHPSVEVKSLKRLHAKVLIGRKGAIVGSANFSANGLNFEGEELAGWEEAGFKVTAEDQVGGIRQWFEGLWLSADVITDAMLQRAVQAWQARSASRVLDPDSPRQLLQMHRDALGRRNVMALIWSNDLSPEADERLEEIKSSAGDAAITSKWSGYENWFDNLRKGNTVLDIHLSRDGTVEINGFVEIFDEVVYRPGTGGEMMSLHVGAPVKGYMGIPKSELLKGLQTKLKKNGLELFADEEGEVATVLPLADFVEKIRTIQ